MFRQTVCCIKGKPTAFKYFFVIKFRSQESVMFYFACFHVLHGLHNRKIRIESRCVRGSFTRRGSSRGERGRGRGVAL